MLFTYCRSEYDRRQKLINKCIPKIVIASTMTTVTVMIILLSCIQSGRADANITVPVNLTKIEDGQTELYSSEVLVATTHRTTVTEHVTDRPDEQIQDKLITTSQGLQTPEEAKRPEMKNDLTAKLLRISSNRSVENDVFQVNSFEVVPLMLNTSTVSKKSPVLAAENLKVNDNNLYPTNHYFDDNNATIGNDNEKYELKKIAHIEVHSENNR